MFLLWIQGNRIRFLAVLSPLTIHKSQMKRTRRKKSSSIVCILVLVPERPPKKITAVSIATDTVQIDWSPVPPEYANGEVLGYKVLYHDVNDTSRANNSLVSPDETHSRINGLKTNTNYSFQVLAFTAKGDGTKSMAYFARTFSGIGDSFLISSFVWYFRVYLRRVFPQYFAWMLLFRQICF